MKIIFLNFCCFLAVCAAQKFPLMVAGEDFQHSFNIDISRSQTQMYLCRLPCGSGDMLIQVDMVLHLYSPRIKSGRYSLQMDKQVHVAITRVNKQDEGFYRVGKTSGRHVNFELKVVDLSDGIVSKNKEHEYWVTPGFNLTLRCGLDVQPTDRKFLCREDCTTFLIDTNSRNGDSAKYALEYNTQKDLDATIKNFKESDSGRYHCCVGRNNSYACHQFTVRVNDSTGVVLFIVLGLLGGIVLTLVINQIHTKRRIQTGHYVNIVTNTTPRPHPHFQPESNDGGAPTYTTLNPESRETAYSAMLPQEQINTDYIQVS